MRRVSTIVLEDEQEVNELRIVMQVGALEKGRTVRFYGDERGIRMIRGDMHHREFRGR